jgi:hypothetical protein
MIHPSENSKKTDIVTLLSGLELFWLFVSIAAIFYFLSLKAPIRMPILFTLYVIFIMIVTVIYMLVLGIKSAAHLPLWLYLLDIGITVWVASWAVQLVRYSKRRQQEERSAEQAAS